MQTEQNGDWVKVWDPVVRIGHWVLVAAFFIAWFSAEAREDLHVLAGYTVGAIVLMRVVWGFVGSKHARFSHFIRGPRAIIAYLQSLLRHTPAHYLGHNPAGGLMILLLLVSLGGTVWTGLELYAVDEHAGPLAAATTNAVSAGAIPTLVPNARAEDDDDKSSNDERDEHRSPRDEKNDEAFWEELHETFATLTLCLVAVHVAGVLVSSWLHRENLVRAMVTGWKRKP